MARLAQHELAAGLLRVPCLAPCRGIRQVKRVQPVPYPLTWRQRLGVRAIRTMTNFAFAAVSVTKQRPVCRPVEKAYGPQPSHRLDVLGPTAEAETQDAAILFIHGGGFIAGDKKQYTKDLQFLCKSGFRVFNMNYPLAPEAPAPAALRSVLQAISWIRTNEPGITRLHLMGDSAGASLATKAAIFLDNRALLESAFEDLRSIEHPEIASVVALYGLFDRKMLFVPGRERAKSVPRLFLYAYGGDDAIADAPLEIAHAVTPMDLEWHRHPRCFLGVGEADLLIKSSRNFALELEQRSVEFQLHTYPDAPHGFMNMNHKQTPSLRRDVLEFLRA